MSNTISPNMGLVIPGVGTESGPTWATDINGDLSSIDSHNHSSGQGVQIQPNGININSDLAFQGNNATLLRSTRFSSQSAALTQPTDVGCLYVVGNELYYNDVTGGNKIPITNNGSVAVTSSGISSGTASAAFSAGVLVVKSSSTSGANVLMQSPVLTNSGNLTNQMTLAAPTLSGSATITLPPVPGTQSFTTIDASGNMAAYAPIANGITRPNLAAVGQQISSSCGFFIGTTGGNITNLSVTITTSGRPVMVFLMADGSGLFNSYLSTSSSTSQSQSQVIIQRGLTILSTSLILTNGPSSGSAVNLPPSFISYFDVVPAGTYTYSVLYSTASGSTFSALRTVLVAYEL